MDAKTWNDRYDQDNFPWDIGGLSPAIKQYLDGIKDKSKRLLIPGAGHSYEAEYLHQKGFSNVYVCDWAETALNEFLKRCPSFPSEHLIYNDFFLIEEQFNLVIEQTFLSALNPKLRTQYVDKMASLLTQNGILAGLIFGVIFPMEGPPFGGEINEYREMFSPKFEIIQMGITNLSIEPRMGNELFIELVKK